MSNHNALIPKKLTSHFSYVTKQAKMFKNPRAVSDDDDSELSPTQQMINLDVGVRTSQISLERFLQDDSVQQTMVKSSVQSSP
jgi:hypothetical protein